jgi:hypothetical protein
MKALCPGKQRTEPKPGSPFRLVKRKHIKRSNPVSMFIAEGKTVLRAKSAVAQVEQEGKTAPLNRAKQSVNWKPSHTVCHTTCAGHWAPSSAWNQRWVKVPNFRSNFPRGELMIAFLKTETSFAVPSHQSAFSGEEVHQDSITAIQTNEKDHYTTF